VAWTLVASDAVGYADGGTGHVYTLPSGVPTAGDLDILAVNSDTVVSTPSGFTLAVSAVNSQGAYLFYRYASGSEGSTVTITTSGSHPTVTGWQRWTGGLGFEVGVEAHVDTSSGSTTPAVSTGTLAGTGRLVVAHAALHALSPTAPNTPVWSGGYTDAGVTASNGSGGTAPALFLGYNSSAGTAAEAPNVTWTQATTDRYILVAVFTPGAGGTTVNGTASLTGAGSLTASAVVRIQDTASLTAAGTVTASAAVRQLATATLTGAGTLTAATGGTTTASAALTAAATLTATAQVRVPGTATLTGAGTLTATGVVRQFATATMTGLGTLTASSGATTPGTAALTAAGSVTAAARVLVPAVATLTGAASVTAVASVRVFATAALTGAGSLAATVAGWTVTGGAPRYVTNTSAVRYTTRTSSRYTTTSRGRQ
jgi:hypothetical protein